MVLLYRLGLDLLQLIYNFLGYNDKLAFLEAVHIDQKFSLFLNKLREKPFRIYVVPYSYFSDFRSVPQYRIPIKFPELHEDVKNFGNWVSIDRLKVLLKIPILFDVEFLSSGIYECGLEEMKRISLGLSCKNISSISAKSVKYMNYLFGGDSWKAKIRNFSLHPLHGENIKLSDFPNLETLVESGEYEYVLDNPIQRIGLSKPIHLRNNISNKLKTLKLFGIPLNIDYETILPKNLETLLLQQDDHWGINEILMESKETLRSFGIFHIKDETQDIGKIVRLFLKLSRLGQFETSLIFDLQLLDACNVKKCSMGWNFTNVPERNIYNDREIVWKTSCNLKSLSVSHIFFELNTDILIPRLVEELGILDCTAPEEDPDFSVILPKKLRILHIDVLLELTTLPQSIEELYIPKYSLTISADLLNLRNLHTLRMNVMDIDPIEGLPLNLQKFCGVVFEGESIAGKFSETVWPKILKCSNLRSLHLKFHYVSEDLKIEHFEHLENVSMIFTTECVFKFPKLGKLVKYLSINVLKCNFDFFQNIQDGNFTYFELKGFFTTTESNPLCLPISVEQLLIEKENDGELHLQFPKNQFTNLSLLTILGNCLYSYWSIGNCKNGSFHDRLKILNANLVPVDEDFSLSFNGVKTWDSHPTYDKLFLGVNVPLNLRQACIGGVTFIRYSKGEARFRKKNEVPKKHFPGKSDKHR